MQPSIFRRLHRAIGDPEELAGVYGEVLRVLFTSNFWDGGKLGFQRVLWTRGWQARSDAPEVFNTAGLYLWGAEVRPLYIGMTRSTLGKRFSRYIWSARSQCNLARKFEHALVSSGIEGFSPEIREWYRKGFRGTTVRLDGAVRFAREGIDRIWFGLMPHDAAKEIRELERRLVPVAEEWNHQHRLRSLLNVEFNRRRMRSAD